MPSDAAPRRSSFATTQWSQVVRAASPESPDGRQALEELCRGYWYPVYAYLRRSGFQSSDAQDLTQGFFADLLGRATLRHARRERGRFRTFLLKACRNYVSNRRRFDRALRRGGQRRHVALEFDWNDGECRYGREPVDIDTPERLYDRRWALELLAAALEEVRQQYAQRDQDAWFVQLRPFIAPTAELPSHAEVAEALGTSPAAVKTAVHRMRRRYRDALLARIAATLSDPQRIDEELAALQEALSEG